MIDFETLKSRYYVGYVTDVSFIGGTAKAYKNAQGVIVYRNAEGEEVVPTSQLERYWKLGAITDQQYSDMYDEHHPEKE